MNQLHLNPKLVWVRIVWIVKKTLITLHRIVTPRPRGARLGLNRDNPAEQACAIPST